MALRTRRSNVPRHRTYQRYKPYLREDFAYACVYCNLHENEAGGPRFMTVEHYRPKSRFRALTNEYSNLLYACGVCNGYKADDWPSNSPAEDGVGYLDPCEHDFDAHIGPAPVDDVVGLTSVGRYMVARLHLNRPMLRTIRRLRREEGETHAQFVELFERNLALLREALGVAEIEPRRREALERDLARLSRQYEQRLGAWAMRWEPRFGLEDYR